MFAVVPAASSDVDDILSLSAGLSLAVLRLHGPGWVLCMEFHCACLSFGLSCAFLCLLLLLVFKNG